jgi:galactose mutarotase-like enzyme
MLAEISNGHLLLIVKRQGAEMTRLYAPGRNVEYVWPADPAFWARHAPVLFPIVGRLKDDTYRYTGQSYRLPQHGFARDRDFDLTDLGENTLTWRLQSDEETLRVFPFPFELYIIYVLDGESLHIRYRVVNPGEGILPFSLGAHPAFRCPLVAGEEQEAYDIRFDRPLSLARHSLEGGLRNGQAEPFLDQADHFSLQPGLFDRDALVFAGIEAQWVELRSRQSGHFVRMSLEGFPYLGIWSKPGAPFVCLEPWQGIADSIEASGELTEKEGIRLLMPGQAHECGYTLSFG